MRSLISLFGLFVFFSNVAFSQSPDWANIKDNMTFNIAHSDEFETPFIQTHYNLGWEDGLHISRDGLHMYAFYLPADLISVNSPCLSSNIALYQRTFTGCRHYYKSIWL